MGWTGGGTGWRGGTDRQSGRRGMSDGTGVDHAVVERSTGRWMGGGWGPRGSSGGNIHSMEGCRWGSFGGGTYAWRRWRRWGRREGRSNGECSGGGEEAGGRREVGPNLHVSATSVNSGGGACCMVSGGVDGGVAVHQLTCPSHLPTGGKFAMSVVPPMEKAVHVCGGVRAGRLLGNEGKRGRVVGAKG